MVQMDFVPLCFVCNKPAQQICNYFDCDQCPFICSGSCLSNAGVKLHTHNEKTYFVSIEDLSEHVKSLTTNQEIDETNKIFKQIKNIKNSLDRLYAQFQKDLENQPKTKFSNNIQTTLQTLFELANHRSMKGKEINRLMITRKIKGIEKEANPILDKQKQSFLKCVSSIEQTLYGYKSKIKKLKQQQAKKQFKTAEKHYKRGQMSQALPRFKMARFLGDVNPDLHMFLGNLQYHFSNFDQAEQNLKIYLQFNKVHEQSLEKLANLAIMKSRFSDAMIYLNQSIYLNQISNSSKLSTELYKRGLVFRVLNDEDSACKDFMQAYKKTNNSNNLLLVFKIYIKQKKYEDALYILSQMMTNSHYMNQKQLFKYWKGTVHFILKDQRQAMESFRSAIDSFNTYVTNSDWIGGAYITKDSQTIFMQKINKLKQVYPNDAMIHFIKGYYHLSRKQFEEAERSLKASILFQKNRMFYECRSRVYNELGRMQEGQKDSKIAQSREYLFYKLDQQIQSKNRSFSSLNAQFSKV